LLITCVYKTGGDFDSDYVVALYDSLKQYGDFLCFTDGDVPDYIPQAPLIHGWKGWWSKIEMIGCGEDTLCFDLDTIVLKDISEMVKVAEQSKEMIMLSDFYYPEKPASGLMYVPKETGTMLYNKFKEDSELYMAKHRGDQDYITSILSAKIERWDNLVGRDYIVSYKAHIAKTAPRHLNIKPVNVDNAKIVCFHGKPRIKDVKEFWNDG